MTKKKKEKEEKVGYRVLPMRKFRRELAKHPEPEFRKQLYKVREKQKETYAKREARIAAGEISRYEEQKKRLKSLLGKTLTNKKIISKGRRAVVVVNVPHRERREIKNIMAEAVEQDRRNFFFK